VVEALRPGPSTAQERREHETIVRTPGQRCEVEKLALTSGGGRRACDLVRWAKEMANDDET
jgi:hypothetical protein